MASPADADDRQKTVDAFQRIFAGLLVEGGTSSSKSSSEAAVEALKQTKLGKPAPKYFSSGPPRLEVLAQLDLAAAEGSTASQEEKDQRARELCTDFLLLCLAMRRHAGPASLEDANFDLEASQRLFKSLSAETLDSTLEALGSLAEGLAQQGVVELCASAGLLRSLLVMLSHPGLDEPGDYAAFKKILQLVGQVHRHAVAKDTLVKWYADMPFQVLEERLAQVQQFITLSLLEAQGDEAGSCETVKAMSKSGVARPIRDALRLLDIIFGANRMRQTRRQDWKTRRRAQVLRQRGELADVEDCKMLPFSQFHNDGINETDGLSEGFVKYELTAVFAALNGHSVRMLDYSKVDDSRRKDFGVVEFPFILTPVSKVRMLTIESLVKQREEMRHAATMSVLLGGQDHAAPWLVLKVRRSELIPDTLQQLGMHQLGINGSDELKKPLKVVFDGEEGVDEGGLRKEFFQLLTEELYNEDFGMFERIDESRNLWFNKNSFEVDLQFELFGTLLGLAIYNQAILDVKFPMAVYKKLMLGPSADLGITDLMDFQPSLAQGLIALLEHEDAGTFQDTFGPLQFVIEYECFGAAVEVELKDNGKDEMVTFENRDDYVRRYCDAVFNKLVERQFGAFKSGFDKIVSDTMFRQLFRWDELELLICGSMDLDLKALEGAAKYQDGFTSTSQAVRWFWEVVHDLNQDDQKRLLQFCTGCDRAPVGGLGRLSLVISRAGPDTDGLPTVHTCFNHLLLPEYATKEKLEQRLCLAIQHCTGFGLM
eukprot:TRINITY_DN16619_c0_g3_i1.p1 TRINITY_DN16619_c0_g3~~TRINITY_DN16619_c0_g3_i1.p1  ORF type:complete len:784 (+),score=151.60 TRINITY_DN16619_c0_g3_i1:51-2354(+)